MRIRNNTRKDKFFRKSHGTTEVSHSEKFNMEQSSKLLFNAHTLSRKNNLYSTVSQPWGMLKECVSLSLLKISLKPLPYMKLGAFLPLRCLVLTLSAVFIVYGFVTNLDT